jgi:hypothetical protein
MQTHLGSHITITYVHLRRGVAALALTLAPVLAVGGYLFFGTPLQASMSAYYYTGMRDWFVGVLCAVGAFLFLYKGYTRRENQVLNLAGVCAPLVALFPMNPAGDCAVGGAADGAGFSWHGVFAVTFFLAISYVCVFLYRDSATDALPPARRRLYHAVARACGGVMLACIGAAVLYNFLMPAAIKAAWCALSVVFWLEAIAVAAFSVHWFFKSLAYDSGVSWLPWRLPRDEG